MRSCQSLHRWQIRGTMIAVCVMTACPPFVYGAWEAPNPAYAAPGTYYNAATGVGTTLQNNLHTIISVMTPMTYGNARYAFALTDADPNHPGNILLIYNNASVSSTWDAGTTYNREHMWPKYWLNVTSAQVSNSYSGPASDMFELRPANPNVNSTRSDYGYGSITSNGVYSGGTYGLNTSSNGSTFWYPSSQDAGEVARAMFYMATRYINYVDSSGGSTGTHTLTLVNGAPTARYTMGDLQSFLHWNYMYGVDNNERARNQAIYANSFFDPSTSKTIPAQGNRNPFVDHPEYVWSLFGDHLDGGGNHINNSQIYVGSPAANGSSTQTFTFRLMQNGTIPTASFSLNKSGADPTTYDITSAGSVALTQTVGSGTATTTFVALGTGQPMDYGTVTKTMALTLSDSTGTIGLKSGIITIKNTDLTSAAAGQGSADGNDTVTINAAVLQKRVVTPNTASLALGRVITSTTVAGTISLSTTLDDNSATRVNVAGSATDGTLSASGSITLFNSASSTGTRTIAGSFSNAGAKSGSLGFAVTTAEAGIGDGVYAPINISYNATSLDHSQASLAAAAGATATTLNFGITVLNTGDITLPFSVFNVQNTASFTAALDIDSITSAGSTSLFTTNATAGTTINAAGSLVYNAIFHPTAAGNALTASYTINTSDEQIPGAYPVGSKPLTLTLTGTVLPNATWKSTAGTLWSDNANWYGSSPSSAGAVATLSTYGTARTISLAAPVTLGTLQINSPADYTLQGTGPLILQSDSTATLQILAGTHTISTPVQANSPLSLDIAPGSSLLVTNTLAATQITKINAGSATLPSLNGGLDVQAGRINLSGTSHFTTLTVSSGAVLDLGTQDAVVDSTSPLSDLSRLASLIATGRNGGAWDSAAGITSSAAAHPSTPELTGLAIALNSTLDSPYQNFDSIPVTADSILIKYTYMGDTNLDGVVNFDDYLAVDYASLTGGTGWTAGDFNYDGTVNAADYALMDTAFLQQSGTLAEQMIQLHLAQYGDIYAQALAADAPTAVPEPASLALLALGMLALHTRRRYFHS